MLHACFYTICLLFRYTSWHFYAFSGTNLLTSYHSASSLFSAIFVFQKWYIGNILEIGRNKFLKLYYTRKLPEIRRRGATRGPHIGVAWPSPWPCHHGVRGPGSSWTRSIFQNTSRSAAAIDPKIGRVQKLFLAPCRRGESPPEVFFIAMLASRAMSE
jgi:hypothetical protein